MAAPTSGSPAFSIEEPGKLSVIFHRQLTEWYEKRGISTDPKILATGESHCKLLASVFPVFLDLKKIKTGYCSTVSSHNWELFTTAIASLGVKKKFNVEKLKIPNSVEMDELNSWMKEFVEMNEKKFSNISLLEHIGGSEKSTKVKQSMVSGSAQDSDVSSVKAERHKETSDKRNSEEDSDTVSEHSFLNTPVSDLGSYGYPLPTTPDFRRDSFSVADENSPFNTAFLTPNRENSSFDLENIRRALNFDD